MSAGTKYTKLFEPIRIEGVTFKNRIVKSAQCFLYAEPDGSAGRRIKVWYEAVARGGAGLVTVEESVCQYPLGAAGMPRLRLDDDRFITGLTELAEAIHKHNCVAILQITHAGPAHDPTISGMQPIAPSSLTPPVEARFSVAREMTLQEIREVVERFAMAALRAKKAGFNGVEVNMAHFALVNAFLSRLQNKRRDEYGCQNLENRARFACEILQRTKELTGPNFIVGARISGKEWGAELGTTVEEAIEFAMLFEKAGVDYLQVSAYGYSAFSGCHVPSTLLATEPTGAIKDFIQRIPTGALIPEAAAIKKAVSIPVSGVGQLDFRIAESILEKGLVDLVCFGRSLTADPEFPNKLAEGREKDIRPCLRCCHCLKSVRQNKPVQCRVNTFVGNETSICERKQIGG